MAEPDLNPTPSDAIATDTIVAISTPPGRGGIGIVRLSGSQAAAIAAELVQLHHPLEHARARLADILDVPDTSEPGADRIDEAVVTFFASPNSYTSDDLVEIAAHGSPVVFDLLLRHALDLGARLAEPGEPLGAHFSPESSTSRKPKPSTISSKRTPSRKPVKQPPMGDALSHRVQPIEQALVELIALLEAGIDFAEDDVDVTPQAEIARRVDELNPALAALEAFLCARPRCA